MAPDLRAKLPFVLADWRRAATRAANQVEIPRSTSLRELELPPLTRGPGGLPLGYRGSKGKYD